MPERKALMADLSDAFVAMPGSTILGGVVARSTCRVTLAVPFLQGARNLESVPKLGARCKLGGWSQIWQKTRG
jgi:hypothetical protein